MIPDRQTDGRTDDAHTSTAARAGWLRLSSQPASPPASQPVSQGDVAICVHARTHAFIHACLPAWLAGVPEYYFSGTYSSTVAKEQTKIRTNQPTKPTNKLPTSTRVPTRIPPGASNSEKGSTGENMSAAAFTDPVVSPLARRNAAIPSYDIPPVPMRPLHHGWANTHARTFTKVSGWVVGGGSQTKERQLVKHARSTPNVNQPIRLLRVHTKHACAHVLTARCTSVVVVLLVEVVVVVVL